MMASASAQPASKARTDIQALRGVAVLLVVLYHSGLGVFQAGYLGVDIFFVISGFLITGIIARGLDAGSFSFANFYTRRARRLLPAAYTMLAAVAVAAFFLLTTTEYRIFQTNLAGSILFSANFTLWSMTGYFHPDSAHNPLLHMWSLAVEEQYYLLLPITLFVLPRRSWGVVIAIATAASLAACLYFAAHKPSVAFFWLPFRAWELGIGSLAALAAQRPPVVRVARALLWPAILAIALVPVRALPGPVPGIGAIIACLGTAAVILARTPQLEGARALAGLARVGDMSYSLYLVHWPLFAISRAIGLSPEDDVPLALALVGASIGLAWLLFRFIERPLHHSSLSGKRLLATALAASAMVLALGFGLGAAKPNVLQKLEQGEPLRGLSPACLSEDEVAFKGKCTQSPAPEMLLWGDSYSAHLVPGLEATSRHPFAQASKGHCSPLIGYAAVATPNEVEFAKGCLDYGETVLDYVRRTKSLKVVILAGQYSRTLPNEGVFALRRDSSGKDARAALGLEPTIQAQKETVALLRTLGVRVIIVSPPPPSDFDLGKCWERAAEHLPRLGRLAGCRLRTDNPARSAQRFEEMMQGFARRGDVSVIRLDHALCHGAQCDIEARGRPIFRDTGHLTQWGSEVIGERLDLGERAWRDAR